MQLLKLKWQKMGEPGIVLTVTTFQITQDMSMSTLNQNMLFIPDMFASTVKKFWKQRHPPEGITRIVVPKILTKYFFRRRERSEQ